MCVLHSGIVMTILLKLLKQKTNLYLPEHHLMSNFLSPPGSGLRTVQPDTAAWLI